MIRSRLVYAAMAVWWSLAPAPAAAQDNNPLWTRSLDELMQVEVVSVGKKEERVFESAAAVYVVTREEIHRSGLTTVPELLRLVPGVTVGRIDASKWAVSVRGFTGRFANKLLVMIDGRSLYSRMFSGVFWDTIGVPVEEIERIEVIRGPGASLWGANAVNGVINIVTRAADADRQTSIMTGAGLGDRWTLGVAHGRATPAGDLRLFGNVSEREGREGFDMWRQALGGLRFRRGSSGNGQFTLDVNSGHGDAGQRSVMFQSLAAPSVVEDVRAETNSFNTVARWVRPTKQSGEWQLTATHDWMQRREPGFFQYAHRISDFSVQHRPGRAERHDFIWGGGVRHQHDEVASKGAMLTLSQPASDEALVNAFVQDQISITTDLKITLGTKVEHTDVTGWNVQPTVRLWWSPDGTTALWAAVSRALRTPSLVDRNVRFNGFAIADAQPLPLLFGLVGNPEVGNEQLAAYEGGLRTTFSGRVALDVTGFYNRYTGLMVQEALPPSVDLGGPLGPHVFIGTIFRNAMAAQTAGIESVAVVTLAPQWQLTGALEIFRLAGWESAVPGVTPITVNGATPRYQWSLRSSYSRGAYDGDVSVIGAAALSEPRVASYARVDARLSRRITGGLELAFAVQNLLHSRHIETATDYLVAPTSVPRTAALRATWRFGGR